MASLVNNNRPLPPGFSEVFILKAIKVDYFDGLTEVFILKDLITLICTKIVQYAQVL